MNLTDYAMMILPLLFLTMMVLSFFGTGLVSKYKDNKSVFDGFQSMMLIVSLTGLYYVSCLPARRSIEVRTSFYVIFGLALAWNVFVFSMRSKVLDDDKKLENLMLVPGFLGFIGLVILRRPLLGSDGLIYSIDKFGFLKNGQ